MTKKENTLKGWEYIIKMVQSKLLQKYYQQEKMYYKSSIELKKIWTTHGNNQEDDLLCKEDTIVRDWNWKNIIFIKSFHFIGSRSLLNHRSYYAERVLGELNIDMRRR